MADQLITDNVSWSPVVVPMDGKNLDQATIASYIQQLANRDAYNLNRIKNTPYGRAFVPYNYGSAQLLPDIANAGVVSAVQRYVYPMLILNRNAEWQATDWFKFTAQFDFQHTRVSTSGFEYRCYINAAGYSNQGDSIGSDNIQLCLGLTKGVAASSGTLNTYPLSAVVHGVFQLTPALMTQFFPLSTNVTIYSVLRVRPLGAEIAQVSHYSPTLSFELYH
jgi:hypothetical protein